MSNYSTELDALNAVASGAANTDKLNVAIVSGGGGAVDQGSTTSGQQGALIQGAVTTSAPSYTTGKTDPLSLTTAGSLRVDASGTTVPVSGTFWQATQPTQLQIRTASGSITTDNGTGSIDCSGMGTVCLQITQIDATATANFEASIDGVTFWAISGLNVQTLDNQAPASTVDPGIWQFNVAGIKTFRIRVAGISSGSVDYILGSSPFDGISSGILATSYVGQSGSWNVGLNAGSNTIGLIGKSYQTTSDTFVTTGNGVTLDCSTNPLQSFSLVVNKTGTVSAWDVRLEGSLDGSNFTQILQSTNVTGTGVTVFTGTSNSPCLYVRARCAGLTLGMGTNIISTILGIA